MIVAGMAPMALSVGVDAERDTNADTDNHKWIQSDHARPLRSRVTSACLKKPSAAQSPVL